MPFLPRSQPMAWLPGQPDFKELLGALRHETAPVLVVGGAVRDFLLGRKVPLTDLDIVVPSPVMPLARRLANRLHWAFFPLDEARDVARLVRHADQSGCKARRKGVPGSLDNMLLCDIAGLRGRSLAEDLGSRDFTVNAMAFELAPTGEVRLIDPWHGQAHLHARLLEAVSERSLVEDPLRLLRAVRMAAQMDFAIAPRLRRQIKELAATIQEPSAERVREEVWKIFAAPSPDVGIDELHNLGLLVYILPEVAAMAGGICPDLLGKDIFDHTLRSVSAAGHLRAWLHGRHSEGSWEPDLANILTLWRHELENYFHGTLSGSRSRQDWLIWHVLLYGKRQFSGPIDRSGYVTIGQLAAERLKRMQFSRSEVELAQAIIDTCWRFNSLHAAFGNRPISRQSCYHFFQTGVSRDATTGLDGLCVDLAGFLATDPRHDCLWDSYFAHFGQMLRFAFQDLPRQEHLLVNGWKLMRKYQLDPGPRLGRLLDGLREIQVVDLVEDVYVAFEWIRVWLREETRG